MRSTSVLLSFALLSPAVMAQGAGPGVIKAYRDSAAFTLANLTAVGTSITQIQMARLPINAPGTWTVALTMGRVTTAYGGNGVKSGAVMGIYDQASDKFTPNTLANAINKASTTFFGLSIEPFRGLVAVMDSPPRVSTRAVFTQPFGAPKALTNLTSAPDPAVGIVGGKLKIFYFGVIGANQGLVMQDLDPTVPKVNGSPVMIAYTPRSGGRAHSPTPILGSDGEVEGLLFAENIAQGGSDMYFANDLDPATPNLLVNDSTSWQNNGGVAGGQFFWADSSGYSTAAKVHDVAWMLGDDEIVGGKVDITAAIAAAIPPPAVTIVLGSDKTIAPVQIPGIGGELGINPGIVFVLGMAAHVDKTQRGVLSFQLPNDPKLKGVRVALQGVSAYAGKNTFTNTAWLTVK